MAFENLKTDKAIQDSGDFIGGNYVLESGIYNMLIDLAYMGEAPSSKAMSLNLVFKGENNVQLKQTIYITSGEAKGLRNYYIDKNGDKQYLPGFNVANALCQLTLDKEIASLETEVKVINLYDYTSKKEIPTKVNMLTDLLNQPVTLGVLKQVVDKNVKNDAGDYVPTGDTREINEISKLFRASDRKTLTEIAANADKAEFIDKWKAKFDGITVNKAKGSGTPSGASGANVRPDPKPAKSLFA